MINVDTLDIYSSMFKLIPAWEEIANIPYDGSNEARKARYDLVQVESLIENRIRDLRIHLMRSRMEWSSEQHEVVAYLLWKDVHAKVLRENDG